MKKNRRIKEESIDEKLIKILKRICKGEQINENETIILLLNGIVLPLILWGLNEAVKYLKQK